MNVDGNLAALRQYERAQDRQEESRELLFENLKPQLTEIENLIAECMSEASRHYDFTDEIKEEILSFF